MLSMTGRPADEAGEIGYRVVLDGDGSVLAVILEDSRRGMDGETRSSVLARYDDSDAADPATRRQVGRVRRDESETAE